MTFEDWFYKEYGGPPILGKDKDIPLDDQLFDAWQAAKAAQKRKDAEIIRHEARNVVLDRDTVLHLLKAIEEQEN